MNRILRLCTLSALCLGAVAANARMDVRSFPHRKDLPLDAAEGKVASFLLDSEMFAATDDRFANLRLLDGNGTEVPYLLRGKSGLATQAVERILPSSVVSFERKEGNEASVVVEISEPYQGEAALLLLTGNRNYEKLASVYEGAKPEGPWTPLARKARVYDYTRFIDVRDNRIALPALSGKFVRVDLSNFEERTAREDVEVTTEERGELPFSRQERRVLREEAIRIDGVEIRAVSTATRPDEPITTAYPVAGLQQVPTDSEAISTWTFASAREPLLSVSFEASSRNFSRRFVLEGSPSRKPAWRFVGDATLHQLQLGDLREHQLSLPLSRESRYEIYRLTVHNQDNPPIALTGVTATGRVYEVLFLPEPAGKYSVVYGGRETTVPSYDVASLLRNASALDTIACTPGPQIPNPLYKPGFTPGGMKPKVIFAVGVGLMILCLLWLIAKGARSVDSLNPAGKP